MGETRRIIVDGEEVQVDEGDDVGRLRTLAGASGDDIATFSPSGSEGIEALTDNDKVSEIPEGARVSFQPIQGDAFGSPHSLLSFSQRGSEIG